MKHGDFALAARLYTDAIILDPANHVLYSNRSAAHLRLNQWDEALHDARKCKQMKPDWSKVRYDFFRRFLLVGSNEAKVRFWSLGLEN